jgi:hypothetical protein
MEIRFTGNKTKQSKALRVGMRGQALIEFAIILILVVLVVAGGAELAITAYGSSKVSDAAKAGATEWGQLISHAKDPNATFTPSPPTPLANTSTQIDVGLGNHAIANFVLPSCGDDGSGVFTYDDGMPDDRYLVDKQNRDNYVVLNAVAPPNNTKSIYLFNPLAIDHESCIGTDPNRDGRSRISILINGYGFMYNDNNTPDDFSDDTLNPLYVPGLPKLNQAMYSMYQQVCLNDGGNPLNDDSLEKCSDTTERLLFPPGKLCLSDDANEESCPEDAANLGETGYYFFGASNIADKGDKEYIPSLPPLFRPTFQIECPGGTFEDSDNASNCDAPTNITNCLSSAAAPCQLRIHVRYRSIFESFITFGLAELPDDALDNLPYFYNPSKVGNGSNNVKGIAGSEIGPIGATGNPTVKPFKDFRGCYESVNPGLLTYQVVSCN